MDDPQLPFLGAVIVEARTNAPLRALVDVRVRGRKPAPPDPDDPSSGDVQPRGKYKNYVVLDIVSAPPHPSLPMTYAEIQARCYGTNNDVAWEVWAALVGAFHREGPRVKASGLGIYRSLVIEGGTQDTDPFTDQPLVTGTIQVIATTQVVV